MYNLKLKVIKMNENKKQYNNLYTIEERKTLISAQLLAIRTQHKFTQKEVAEAIGVKLGTYNAYEKQRSEPPAEIIVRLAYFYNVSTDEMLQKDNLMKDPEKSKEQLQEFTKALELLQKEVEQGNPEAIKTQSEILNKGGSFFVDIMKNITTPEE